MVVRQGVMTNGPANASAGAPADRAPTGEMPAGETPGEAMPSGQMPGEAMPGERAAAPPQGATSSANAVRIARHRDRRRADGVAQVNVQAPLTAHATIKELARRLTAGAGVSETLFDLAAAQADGSVAPPSGRRHGRQGDSSNDHRDNQQGDHRSGTAEPAAAPAGIDLLLVRVRSVLEAGGWKAGVIRRLVG